MPTIRSVTSTISIAAPPSAVLDLVGDARTLPDWAPGFAQSVRAEGDHWRVNDAALIDVVVSREHGTVDIVSAEPPRRGVFTRVLGNGDGSEYLFTQFFPDGATDAEVQAQVAVVEGELETVRRLTEASRR
jgi:carbon monoxide dehydrogenase subunit G